MDLKYEDLIIANSQDKSEIYTVLDEPLTKNQVVKALFFALIEINISPEVNSRIVSIFDEIKQKYYQLYQNEAEAAETDISENFENILAKINYKLSLILETNVKSFDIREINFIVGIIHHKTIILSQLGQTRAFLLHQISDPKKNKDEKARYKVIDILEIAEGTLDAPNPAKIFSNIISGNINKGDSVVICNESLTDYLSLDKIKKTVTALPVKSAVEMFKNILGETDAAVNFAGLIIKTIGEKELIKTEKATIVEPLRKSDSHESVARLIATERKTEKLLTPSIKPNLKKMAADLSLIFKKKLPQKILTNQDHALKTKTLHRKKIQPLKQVISLLIKFFSYLFHGDQTTITTISDQKNLKLVQEKITRQTSAKISQTSNWFNRLPQASKILLVLAIVLLGLFLVSLKLLNYQSQRKTEQIAYDQKLVVIKTTINAVAAREIHDEEGARTKLKELANLLAELPQNTSARKTKYQQMQKEIEAQSFKLKHIIEITDPVILFNFSSLDSTVKLRDLAKIDQLIYTFNPDNNVIYKFNAADNTVQTIDKSTFKLGDLRKSLIFDKNVIIYLLNNNQLAQLNLSDNSIRLTNADFSDKEKNITDIATYNNNLYALSPENNQIYKHVKSANGFAKAQAWLKTSLDFNQANSLAIDGSIYVLKSDGQIYKLLRGEQQTMNISQIDPALTNPIKIITDANLANLYIIEPVQKRIVVLDKNGQLINQYYSEKFNDLKDVLVDEKTGSMHVLNGQILYGIALKK